MELSTLITLFLYLIPALIVNSLALYCVVTDIKSQKTIVKEMLLLLIIVDLSSTFGIGVHHVVTPAVTEPSDGLCILSAWLTTVFPLYATGIGMLLACERMIALTAPYWYHSNMFRQSLRLPMLLLGIYVAAICLFPGLGLGSFRKMDGNSTVKCTVFPSKLSDVALHRVFPLVYSCSGVLFITASVGCNMVVIKALYKLRYRISPRDTNKMETAKKISQEFVLTKMVFVLTLTFLLCLTPLYIELLMVQTGHVLPKAFTTTSHTLNGLNVLLDPLINICIKPKYRRLLASKLCCKKQTQLLDSTTNANGSAQTNKEITEKTIRPHKNFY